jgi:hypothetical protein
LDRLRPTRAEATLMNVPVPDNDINVDTALPESATWAPAPSVFGADRAGGPIGGRLAPMEPSLLFTVPRAPAHRPPWL